MTSTMANDRYRTPPQAPPVFKTTADAILADMKAANAGLKSVVDKVVADVPSEKANFANVLHPILLEENKAAAVRTILSFYQYVSTDEKLRTASTSADELMSDFNIEASMREDAFNLVNAAYGTRDAQKLETEPLRILEKERQGYIQNGLLLPVGPKRDRFKEIQKRLSQLCIQAQKNLNEEKGFIWFTPEELDGVPSDDIDVTKLEKGTGENEGKVKLSFKYNVYFPVLKYANHESTRRRYTIADANKANINIPLFQEIIELRDEAARLLGYSNHAASRIEDKMAKSADKVNEFLDDLRVRLAPGGLKEADKLREYKKKDCEERGVPFDGNIYTWDLSFYSRKLREQEYSIDEMKISQYFPVESTFDGMLKIFEEIFGLAFVELKEEDRARLSPTGKAEDIAWHEEVRIFSVWNDEAGGAGFIGYLYIDLYPRDNKYGHMANFNLEPGFITEDGEKHYPATALVCNFSKPSESKPGLLKHREAITMFHELGHGIHDLVARTRYSYFHGTAVVRDFVEAPSQMLENWCWTPSVLKALSKHWESGESIPDELVDGLIRTKHFNTATDTLGQIVIGTFDMTVHSPESQDAVKAINPGRLWNQLRHDISAGLKGPEDAGETL